MKNIKVFDNILNNDELTNFEKVIKNKPKNPKVKTFKIRQLWKVMKDQIVNDINN